MSICNLTKEEIITHLQVSEYYADEMRETLHKIQELFEISITSQELKTHDWDIDNDEHYGDVLYHKLYDYKLNQLNQMTNT